MIIVLGSNGMLGRYVYDYLKFKCEYVVVGINRSNLDAANPVSVRKAMDYIVHRGDIVINCMGVTNKRSELSTANMYMVNAVFPHILDRICNRKGAYLIHPSTDCVFTGDKGNYKLSDNKDCESDYGLSKSIGEEMCNSVIRVSIIGEEEKDGGNLISWCQANKGQTVSGYTDHFWNGITCLEWCKLVERIIRERDWWCGVRVYQSLYKGRKCVSKAELVQCISEAYNLNMTILPIKTGKKNDRTLCGEVVEDDLTDQIDDLVEYTFACKPVNWIYLNSSQIVRDPYPHIVLDNALPEEIALHVAEEIFDIPDENFKWCSTPFEQCKTLMDKYSLPPYLESLWRYLNSAPFLSQLSGILGVKVYPDEIRLWSGVEKFCNNDYLFVHTDAGSSPFSGKKREATIDIYFTRPPPHDWKEDYGGAMELWSSTNVEDQIPTLDGLVRRIDIKNNRMVMYQCTDNSWHGISQPRIVPKDIEYAYFTVSYISDRVEYGNKKEYACFTPRPNDRWDEEVMSLVRKMYVKN